MASSTTPAKARKKTYRTAENRGEIRVAGERLLTVAEAAQSLGLCIDSVRRHLRSGKLEGVRVGGAWRVPQSTLMAQLGLLGAMITPGAAMELPEDERAQRPTRMTRTIEASEKGSMGWDAGEADLVATLLRAPATRARVLELVEAAAMAAQIAAPERARLADEVEKRLV